MQFFNLSIDFELLADHAAFTCAARVSERELLAFCKAAHADERRLVALWGRPVHLDTLIEGKPIRLSHDGTECKRIKREKEEP